MERWRGIVVYKFLDQSADEVVNLFHTVKASYYTP